MLKATQEFYSAAVDSDLWFYFRQARGAQFGAAIMLVMVLVAVLAPLLALQNPYDLAGLNLLDAYKPTAFQEGGQWRFPIGSDEQGRDVFSTIVYGLRVSIFVGAMAVFSSAVIGVTLGLIAGYFGGYIDSVIMQIAEIELTLPAILIALFIIYFWSPGVWTIIIAIAAVEWVLYARTARASVISERERGYVEAAEATGVSWAKIIFRHILPNIITPIIVIANVRFGWVIILEASLSFLGVGMPAERPSLGRLILNGYEVLFSGLWWVSVFPGVALVLLVLGVNLVGDWLSDELNPKLQA